MSGRARWTGRDVPRREDLSLLTGVARFMDDLEPLPGIHHAAICRSPHAHAEIESIDAGAALRLPGVVGVLTGADVAALSEPLGNVIRSAPKYFPCAVDRVRYFGEPVAVVVARDRYVAEDAAELVDVRYRPLDAVVDPERAVEPDAPVLHPDSGSNLVHCRRFRYGNPEGAFAAADLVVEHATRYPRVSSTPIETYGVIAHYDPGYDRYTAWSNFQGPYTVHPLMAMSLRVPTSRLRLISPPASGGSFGIKQGIYPYVVLIALASRKLGVPVKWIEDRVEHLCASSSSTDRVARISGAFTTDGSLTALCIRNLDNVGAYLRAPEPASTYRMHGTLNGPYRVANIDVEHRIAVTNQVPTGLNRGFGGPQHFYPLERLLDIAARRLAMDPAKLRRINLVTQFPYQCPSGSILESGDYTACLDRLLESADYTGLCRQREEARKQGRLFGIGIAAAVETSGSNMGYVTSALTPEERRRASPKSGGPSNATVSFDPLGRVTVQVDSTPNGQGHATTICQVVADELGLSPDDIEVNTQLDTGVHIWTISSGNYANRFSTAVAPAAALAAREVADQLRALAAHELDTVPEAVELADGLASAPEASNRTIPIARLAAQTHWNSAGLPGGMEPCLRATRSFTHPSLKPPDEEDRIPSSLTYSFMCDLAAVEVERDTGHIDIRKYVTVHDVGTILNPALVEGQIHGGFAHGLGAAALERIAYAPDGSLLTGTFAEYTCPTATEVPAIRVEHLETPSPNTPLGAKGTGDGPTLTVAATLGNALADALGIEELSPPFTPSRVWSMARGHDPDPALTVASAPEPEESGAARLTLRGPITGDGEVTLDATAQEVWNTLFDPEALQRVIPGCRSVTRTAPDTFHAVVRISVGGIGGSYDVRIRFADQQPTSALRVEGQARGRLGHGKAEALVSLAPAGNGSTCLGYRYVATAGGTVASVGSRMLDSVARMLIRDFFAGLNRAFVPEDERRGRLRGLLQWAADLARGRRSR